MGMNRLFRRIAFGLCLLLATPIGALCQPSSVAPAQAPAPAVVAADAGATVADQNYVMGSGDVIEVGILGRTDFTTRGRIAADGTIQLPYLGVVQAANKTAQKFGDEIAGLLEKGGFYSHPVVKVDVASYASRYVIVLGYVVSPGLVPVDRAYRLSEILARVGGTREGSADYVVVRPEHGAERHYSVKTLATGEDTQDPYVSPGDKIYSPKADVFYIQGQVRSPGSYAIEPDMPLRMALAKAGGLTESGNEHGVKITRKGVRVAGVNLDSKIEPGDVIVVGERLF